MVEIQLLKLIVSLPIIYATLAMLEALWSRREVMQYIVFTTGVSGFVTLVGDTILHAVVGESKDFAFHESLSHSGCAGLVFALVIGFRHAFPYKEVVNLNKYFQQVLPARGLVQSRHIPFICLLSEFALAWFFPLYFTEWPLAMAAYFSSWFYIRYLMWFPYANLRGDHSSEFTLSLLFPKPLRPPIDRVSERIYSFSCKFSRGLLKLRESDKVSLSMYSPTESAAASAVIEGFGETTQEKRTKFEEQRIKALKFLDDNIAALMGSRPLNIPSVDNDDNIRLVQQQRNLGDFSSEEIAQV